MKKQINIAVIPARSGSKRIKNKNIKLFFSKPMIAWTIESLKKSKLYDKIVVTSDSQKILNISKKSKADILIKRPKILSGDRSKIDDAMQHAIKYMELKFKINLKIVSCFFPCNPFLRKKELILAHKILKKKNNGFILSVTKYKHPIQRAYTLEKKNNYIEPKNKKSFSMMTQDFLENYHDAAQFYVANKKTWFVREKKKFGVVIPIWRSVDIDDSDDWKNAELLFKSLI